MPRIKANELITEKDQAEVDKLYRSITLECRGHDKAVLASYSRFLTTAAKHLEICVDNIDNPRHHIIRYDTLKSAFVKKKHRVQYEIRTYFLIIKFLRLTSSTADSFLEYVQRNIPEGVAMIVTKELSVYIYYLEYFTLRHESPPLTIEDFDMGLSLSLYFK
ncbi:putative 28S ribosomal protein S10, mitochondrial [Armadillidium vulgare]|nr:putative 28S ribosomal protein S10, mitochondrial [Armadillidium vulgare]